MDYLVVVVVSDVLRTNLKSYWRRRISVCRRTGSADGVVQKRVPRGTADAERYLTYVVPECRSADAEQEEVDGVVCDAQSLAYLSRRVNPRIQRRSLSVGPPAQPVIADLIQNHVGQLEANRCDAHGD